MVLPTIENTLLFWYVPHPPSHPTPHPHPNYKKTLTYYSLGKSISMTSNTLPSPSLTYFARIKGEFKTLSPQRVVVPSFHTPVCPSAVEVHYDSNLIPPFPLHLPPSVTILFWDFNLPLDVPPSITSLTFGSEFNQPLDNLPPSLKRLKFISVSSFSHSLDNLPPSLTHLLGVHFNQPVDHLPSSLVQLELFGTFNQPIDHLPASLTHLSLGMHFGFPGKYLFFTFLLFLLFLFFCSFSFFIF